MQCSLNVHWIFTECSLNVRCIFTECSLNVHWMFTECSLNVHWIFTECSLKHEHTKYEDKGSETSSPIARQLGKRARLLMCDMKQFGVYFTLISIIYVVYNVSLNIMNKIIRNNYTFELYTILIRVCVCVCVYNFYRMNHVNFVHKDLSVIYNWLYSVIGNGWVLCHQTIVKAQSIFLCFICSTLYYILSYFISYRFIWFHLISFGSIWNWFSSISFF
jgi:hypothetical protein